MQPVMRGKGPHLMGCLCAVAALLAAGCGGAGAGGNGATGSMGMPGTSTAPAEGSLLHSPPQLVSTETAPALQVTLNLSANQELLLVSGSPVCDVQIYRIEYETVGGANEATTAAAALMVPTGSGASCTGARPLVLYAHGTSTDKTFTMTDLGNAEALALAAVFASQGYVVVAPNYAGFDTSTLPYHPYLVAAQQAQDMIDALHAARTALPLTSTTAPSDGGKLFITGYSQGGYVAMATHRAMEAAGQAVTAASPMSGPYALAAFADAVFYGEVNGGAPISTSFLLTAYQRSYGNIYASAAAVFEAPYAAGIDSLLPSTMTRSQLYAQDLLPQYALFSATPPAPQYAADTPATTPAELAEVFAVGFGSGNLILNSYRLSYLEDAQANPDGGFPTVTTGLPASSPQLPWRQALLRNDLRNWVPVAPVQLCGGDEDPVVFWLNTQLMQNYWAAHAPAAAAIGVLDLEAPVSTSDAYTHLKQGFQAAKTVVATAAVLQGATDGGASAVAEAYHATLVAPFCFAAAQSFFSHY